MILNVGFVENEENIVVGFEEDDNMIDAGFDETHDTENNMNFIESSKEIPVGFEENDGSIEPDFGEIQEINRHTSYHNSLANRNIPDQHQIGAITGLQEALNPATKSNLGRIMVGDNLRVTDDGILSVDTADNMEEDNTRPITAAAVATQVGNIEILLATI